MPKITPVLYVESIEACLPFWVDALGFTKTAEVPEGDRLGFVILISGSAEVMLQSYASLEKDIPSLGKKMRGAPSVLYIEVKNIGELERRLEGYEIVAPRRKTLYGATEIFFRSPGGHIVGFAQQEERTEKSQEQEKQRNDERGQHDEKDRHFLDHFNELLACRFRGRGDS